MHKGRALAVSGLLAAILPFPIMLVILDVRLAPGAGVLLLVFAPAALWLTFVGARALVRKG